LPADDDHVATAVVLKGHVQRLVVLQGSSFSCSFTLEGDSTARSSSIAEMTRTHVLEQQAPCVRDALHAGLGADPVKHGNL
jgi:hypothetical protein